MPRQPRPAAAQDALWTHRWMSAWEVRGQARESWWRRATPPQLFVGSFAALIVLGTLGLRFLPGLYVGEGLGWLDALFTATSAVCVTGLIVVDTATYFTFWGQAFVLLLIQLGGLGIISFTTLIIVALGRRLSLRHEQLAGPEINVGAEVEPRRLARDVVRFTLMLEALGALVLYLMWVPRLGWGPAAWHAVFQAISAFCNAGFSTFSDSLTGFSGSPGTLLVMATLIVAGGLGFLTLEELHMQRRAPPRARRRLSVHTLVVLGTTAILLAGGLVLYAFFEWRGVLADMAVTERLMNALFMSVTARTAGFNTIDYAQAGEATNFLTILLMTIGGSPGSTAGGLKTTTVALIGLLALARLRGRVVVSIGGRSIPEETVQRAVGLFVLASGFIAIAVFVYTFTELTRVSAGGVFLDHMFEAVSAFNTVGLSLGVTPELTAAGRSLTIVLMFVGRVGPLVLAAALARRAAQTADLRYSYEDVVIG